MASLLSRFRRAKPARKDLFDPGWISVAPSGSTYDYRQDVGRVYDNSIVSDALNKVGTTFGEAPIQVERSAKGEWESMADHPLVHAVQYGNPWYDESVLWFGTLVSWFVAGNAYWIKIRDRGDRVSGFHYVPHWQVAPKSDDTSQVVTHYEYNADYGGRRRLKLSDVVHFRHGIDPTDPKIGLSPLAGALREVAADNYAATLGSALLRNMGIASFIIAPKAGETAEPTPEQAKKVRDDLTARLTGDGAGRFAIMPFPVDLHSPQIDPDKLGAEKLSARAVSRILAAFGIDPMVLGLPSDSKTYSNYREALEAYYRTTLQPLKATIAKQLDRQVLGPDFGQRAGFRVGWDYSGVWVFEDDEDATYRRAGQGYKDGILRRSEARAMVGQTPDKGDDLYATDLTSFPAVPKTLGQALRLKALGQRAIEECSS